MECVKIGYHILLERLRRHKHLTLVSAFAPDGSVSRTIVPEDGAGGVRLLRQENGRVTLCEPFARPQRLILLGDTEATRRLTERAAVRGFCVVVADSAPGIAAHLPQAHQTICDSLPAALRCLHLTDEDCVILAPARYAEAAACIEQLWEEPQPTFLGLLNPSPKKNWLCRLKNEGIADADWLGQMTVISVDEGADAAAEEMLCRLEERVSEASCPQRGMDVVELLSRLPAERLEQRRVVMTAARAREERDCGRKMILFEDGSSFGSLGGGAPEALALKQARNLLGRGGWQLVSPDEQTDILLEAE